MSLINSITSSYFYSPKNNQSLSPLQTVFRQSEATLSIAFIRNATLQPDFFPDTIKKNKYWVENCR